MNLWATMPNESPTGPGESLSVRELVKQKKAQEEAQAREEQKPPLQIRRLHVGLIPAALMLAGTAFFIDLAVFLHPNDLFGFSIAGAVVMLIVFFVFGTHDRCPRCKGWFARWTLHKQYSHTSASTETVHDSSGGHRTVTVHRKIYRGDFLCQRCGLRWNDFM
jgi:hypothetical protein